MSMDSPTLQLVQETAIERGEGEDMIFTRNNGTVSTNTSNGGWPGPPTRMKSRVVVPCWKSVRIWFVNAPLPSTPKTKAHAV